MSMTVRAFEGMMRRVFLTFQKYPNAVNDANTIRIQLGSDTTVHDTTIRTAPTGLQPGHRTNSQVQRAMLRLVNAGKAGNLSTVTMANIIGGLLPLAPPVNVTPPTLTLASGTAGTVGAAYAANAGTWNPNTGNTRTNQWTRNGTAIGGATSPAYTIVAADSGTTVTCVVTMTNAGGSNSAAAVGVAIA